MSYTRIDYSSNQNQLTAKDNGQNKTVSFSYSPRGLLSRATDAYGAQENYTYDAVGNLTLRQDTVATKNFTTNYAYTPRNQMKQVVRGPDTTSYTFDAAGNLASKTYQNGISTSYSYDAANRLTAMQAVKGAQTLQSYSQAFYQNSNVTSLTEAAGTTSYAYDPLNRLTAENIAGYGNLSYAYDKTGNRLTKTEPSASGGPALALSMTRIYWASYSDWQNHQLSVDYKITGNGPGTAFATRVTASTATNGVYPVTSMPLPLGDIAQGASAPFTLKYFIPSAVGSFTATVYSACQDGNGTGYAFPAKRTSYSYNQASELASSYDYQGTTTNYAYNANGALTQKTTGTSTTSYAYNGRDKLTQVTTPTSTVNYAYDALGRRIGRTDATGTINYQLNGKSDLTDYETNAGGNLTGSYLRGADGLISRTDYTGQSPLASYYLYNPHGESPRLSWRLRLLRGWSHEYTKAVPQRA